MCASRWRHSPLALSMRKLNSAGRRSAHGLQTGAVVLVDEALGAPAEQLALGPPDHRGHRSADVAAATLAEHHDEVARGLREAAEVRGLPARRRDQRRREQQRDQQPADAERDLQHDQVADVLVGAVGDRAGDVQRDVRGAAPPARAAAAIGSASERCSARCCGSVATGLARQHALRRSRVRSLTSRCSCLSCARSTAPLAATASSRRRRRARPAHRRRRAAPCALPPRTAAIAAGSACSPARTSSTSLT